MSDPLSGGDEDAGEGPIVVSSANFTESEIIGNLYAQALEGAGDEVETQFNIGSREAYIPALSDGSIDVIPEYTGNLLLFLDPEADVSSPDAIAEALPAALEAKGSTASNPRKRRTRTRSSSPRTQRRSGIWRRSGTSQSTATT